jgi:hypothetical protein
MLVRLTVSQEVMVATGHEYVHLHVHLKDVTRES